MDRLTFYRHYIQTLLTEYTKGTPINGEIEVQTVFDIERDRYRNYQQSTAPITKFRRR